MTAQTKGVDVRGVLAEVRSFMAATHPEYDTADRLQEVGAAIYELIEASSAVIAGIDLHDGNPDEAYDRLRAALARCGSQP